MTATWKIHGNRRTYHYLSSGDQLSLLYDQLVYHTPASEILRLNQNPADYLFPYVRESARYGASICAQLAPFRGGHKISQDFNLDTEWEINQQNRRAMMFSLTSLSRFLADSEVNLNPRSSSLKLYGISSDYCELIMESEMIAADLQVLLQQQAHLANIQEARRGVEQADSVSQARQKMVYSKVDWMERSIKNSGLIWENLHSTVLYDHFDR
ncbi:hypothetical protein N7488_002809 [Penicillium malachiteum]|nr:hypothetical protein N7488_002809 [Penicillium malachiteum]